MKMHIVVMMIISMIGQEVFAQIGKQKRDWVKVDDDNNIASFYIDHSSIVNSEGVVRMLIMSDLHIADGKYKSSITEILIKCDSNGVNKFYSEYGEFYADGMLQGALIAGGKYSPRGDYESVYGSYVSIAKKICKQ